jgi:hypothetical protein
LVSGLGLHWLLHLCRINAAIRHLDLDWLVIGVPVE